MASNTFKAQTSVPRGRIYDAVVTGLEGGCYSSIGVVDGSTWEPAWRAAERGEAEAFAKVVAYDREAATQAELNESRTPLTDAAIQKGLAILAEKAPACVTRIIEENDDVIDGDALMQCIVLGEVVYG